MEFGLSEEQRMLESAVRGFLADRLPLDRLREIAKSGLGFEPELWEGLVEQGISGLLVPEHLGGTGLGMLDAAIVAESIGYQAAPVPFAASLVMAPMALRLSGAASQQEAWLPRIAAGEARFGVAFASPVGQTGAASVRLDGGRLSGRVQGGIDGGGATHHIVYLADGRAGLVEAGAKGVAATHVVSLDRTRPMTELAFEGAACELLDAANDPKAAATSVLDAGRVMLAADTLGATQAMLDKAVAYAKERVQFERVIGSFQGVKHTLADLVTMLEPCRSLIWFAAHAQDAVPEQARLAALQAKAHLGDVGREVARLTTEVHGGMGFTDLLGLHYWYKRAAFDRQLLGSPERCRREAAIVQGWARA